MSTIQTSFRRGNIKRGIAAITTVIFLSMEILSVAPSSFAQTVQVTTQKQNRTEVLSHTEIQIPSEMGLIEESFVGTSGKTMVYIQDAHDSLEAQENIAAMINHLVKNYGVKTVFEEGYKGPVPTDKYFGLIKNPKIRERIAYFLMDHLRIGGAEYAHITRKKPVTSYQKPETSPPARRGGPARQAGTANLRLGHAVHSTPYTVRANDFQLIGADSIRLHKQNIRQYQKAAKQKKQIEADLSALETEIRALADRHFPKELKDWIREKELVDQNKLPLLDYLRRSSEKLPKMRYPGIRQILEGGNANHLNPREIFQEINAMEQEIADGFLKNERDKQIFKYQRTLHLLKRLNDLTLSSPEYEVLVKKPVTRNQRRATQNDGLSSMPARLSARGRIRLLFGGLSGGDYGLSASTHDIAQFIHEQTGKTLILSKRWEKNIRDAVRFYEIAQERDRVIAKTIDKYFLKRGQASERLSPFPLSSRSDVSVIVYGGFHKENIKEILKSRRVSYLIVTPKITQASKRHQDYYKQLMTVGRLPFELPANLRIASRVESSFEIWDANPLPARAELRSLESVARNTMSVDYPSFRLALEQNRNTVGRSRSEVRTNTSQPGSTPVDDGGNSLANGAGGEAAAKFMIVDRKGFETFHNQTQRPSKGKVFVRLEGQEREIDLQIPAGMDLNQDVKQVVFAFDLNRTILPGGTKERIASIPPETLDQIVRAFRLMKKFPELKIRFLFFTGSCYHRYMESRFAPLMRDWPWEKLQKENGYDVQSSLREEFQRLGKSFDTTRAVPFVRESIEARMAMPIMTALKAAGLENYAENIEFFTVSGSEGAKYSKEAGDFVSYRNNDKDLTMEEQLEMAKALSIFYLQALQKVSGKNYSEVIDRIETAHSFLGKQGVHDLLHEAMGDIDTRFWPWDAETAIIYHHPEWSIDGNEIARLAMNRVRDKGVLKPGQTFYAYGGKSFAKITAYSNEGLMRELTSEHEAIWAGGDSPYDGHIQHPRNQKTIAINYGQRLKTGDDGHLILALDEQGNDLVEWKGPPVSIRNVLDVMEKAAMGLSGGTWGDVKFLNNRFSPNEIYEALPSHSGGGVTGGARLEMREQGGTVRDTNGASRNASEFAVMEPVIRQVELPAKMVQEIDGIFHRNARESIKRALQQAFYAGLVTDEDETKVFYDYLTAIYKKDQTEAHHVFQAIGQLIYLGVMTRTNQEMLKSKILILIQSEKPSVYGRFHDFVFLNALLTQTHYVTSDNILQMMDWIGVLIKQHGEDVHIVFEELKGLFMAAQMLPAVSEILDLDRLQRLTSIRKMELWSAYAAFAGYQGSFNQPHPRRNPLLTRENIVEVESLLTDTISRHFYEVKLWGGHAIPGEVYQALICWQEAGALNAETVSKVSRIFRNIGDKITEADITAHYVGQALGFFGLLSVVESSNLTEIERVFMELLDQAIQSRGGGELFKDLIEVMKKTSQSLKLKTDDPPMTVREYFDNFETLQAILWLQENYPYEVFEKVLPGVIQKQNVKLPPIMGLYQGVLEDLVQRIQEAETRWPVKVLQKVVVRRMLNSPEVALTADSKNSSYSLAVAPVLWPKQAQRFSAPARTALRSWARVVELSEFEKATKDGAFIFRLSDRESLSVYFESGHPSGARLLGYDSTSLELANRLRKDLLSRKLSDSTAWMDESAIAQYVTQLEWLSLVGVLKGRVFYPSMGMDYFPALFAGLYATNLYSGLGSDLKTFLDGKNIERSALLYRLSTLDQLRYEASKTGAFSQVWEDMIPDIRHIFSENNFNFEAWEPEIVKEGPVDVVMIKGMIHWLKYYMAENSTLGMSIQKAVRAFFDRLHDGKEGAKGTPAGQRLIRPGTAIIIMDPEDEEIAEILHKEYGYRLASELPETQTWAAEAAAMPSQVKRFMFGGVNTHVGLNPITVLFAPNTTAVQSHPSNFQNKNQIHSETRIDASQPVNSGGVTGGARLEMREQGGTASNASDFSDFAVVDWVSASHMLDLVRESALSREFDIQTVSGLVEALRKKSKGVYTLESFSEAYIVSSARRWIALGIRDTEGKYSAFVKRFGLQDFYDVYFKKKIQPTAIGHTDMFLQSITSGQSRKAPVVFFVPTDLLKGNGVTYGEITWLLNHPERIKNVYFVFGAYEDFLREPTIPKTSGNRDENRFEFLQSQRRQESATRLKAAQPVLRHAVLVMEASSIEALSPEDFRKLLLLAGTHRKEIRLVIPDMIQGKYSNRLEALRSVARVTHRLPTQGDRRQQPAPLSDTATKKGTGFRNLSPSDSGKVPVFGFSDMHQDTAEALRTRLGPKLAARLGPCFHLDGIRGIALALLVPPGELQMQNGFLYDATGRFESGMASFFETLAEGYELVSSAA